MHLYAKDMAGTVVFAEHGVKQKDYFCLECQGPVRLRKGIHRQSHFYHLESHRVCQLNGKSMTHIQIQYSLQALFSLEDCFLEHRFPEINRIADVVWLPHRLVFEIQCSPISANEVQERNRDYRSIGYQVVWILHDKRFNQWRVSAAENYLKQFPHYYTNIDAEGQGIIYDQYSLISRGIRKGYLSPLSINVNQPLFPKPSEWEKIRAKIPATLLERIEHWPLFFSGDLLSRFLGELNSFLKTDYWTEILKMEAMEIPKLEEKFSYRKLFKKFIARPYQIFFQYILEKACK